MFLIIQSICHYVVQADRVTVFHFVVLSRLSSMFTWHPTRFVVYWASCSRNSEGYFLRCLRPCWAIFGRKFRICSEDFRGLNHYYSILQSAYESLLGTIDTIQTSFTESIHRVGRILISALEWRIWHFSTSNIDSARKFIPVGGLQMSGIRDLAAIIVILMFSSFVFLASIRQLSWGSW